MTGAHYNWDTSTIEMVQYISDSPRDRWQLGLFPKAHRHLKSGGNEEVGCGVHKSSHDNLKSRTNARLYGVRGILAC